MTLGTGPEDPGGSIEVMFHLSQAHDCLLRSMLHLAAVEDDVADDNLLSSRRLMATSLKWIKGAHQKLAY